MRRLKYFNLLVFVLLGQFLLFFTSTNPQVDKPEKTTSCYQNVSDGSFDFFELILDEDQTTDLKHPAKSSNLGTQAICEMDVTYHTDFVVHLRPGLNWREFTDLSPPLI